MFSIPPKLIFPLSVLFAALGSLLVWALMDFPLTGIDDADIFFVYARHFADRHGLVYNIGDPPVEGFTSLFWTLICSAGYFVFSRIEWLLFTLNILMGGFIVSACLRRAKHPLFFLAFMAAAPAWFAWCQLTLMESGLWCLLITASILAVAEQRVKTFAALLPLLLITRPESMLWGAWLIFILIVSADREKRKTAAIFLPLIYLLSLGALIAFRLAYFGYPVPNTYYAKVSPDFLSNLAAGFSYFTRYFISSPAVAIALLLSGWALFKGGRGAGKPRLILFALLPGIGIPVLVGGDHFGAFRFYQPLWPLLCLIVANSGDEIAVFLEKVGRFRRKRRGRFVEPSLPIFCSLLILSGWVLFHFTAHLKHEFRIAREGRENGDKLTAMFNDLEYWPTVAVITAGGNKLHYDGRVLDLMGLNWPEMAHAERQPGGDKNHSAFNREVFYRWMPDILLCGDSAEFDNRVLKGLHNEIVFNTYYRKCTIHRNGESLNACYKIDFLFDLPAKGNARPGE